MNPSEETLRLFASMRLLHEPGRKDRHEAAGKEVGGDHGEADGERERNEKLPPHTLHKEGRHKDCQNAQHGQQTGDDRSFASFEHCLRPRYAGQHLGVDVLNFNRRFIDQHSHGQRETSEGHHVDGLPSRPEAKHRCEERERNVGDNNKRTAPVTQEEQHDKSREHSAESGFPHQSADGIGNIAGLIEGQLYIDIVRNDLLKTGDRVLHRLDDSKRGCVRPLRNRNVDGSTAIHVGVGRDNVGAVLDAADVAKVDVGSRLRMDRSIHQFREVWAEGGVGAYKTIETAVVKISCGSDDASGADG